MIELWRWFQVNDVTRWTELGKLLAVASYLAYRLDWYRSSHLPLHQRGNERISPSVDFFLHTHTHTHTHLHFVLVRLWHTAEAQPCQPRNQTRGTERLLWSRRTHWDSWPLCSDWLQFFFSSCVRFCVCVRRKLYMWEWLFFFFFPVWVCRKKKNNDPGLSGSFSQLSVSVCICVCVCVSACVHMCDCLWLSVSPGFFFPW